MQLGIGAPTPETGTMAPGTAKVRVRHNLKPWELSASATPSDTGCTITLVNLDEALWNDIHIERTKTVELYHAAGGSMHIEGMANIRVCANNIQRWTGNV